SPMPRSAGSCPGLSAACAAPRPALRGTRHRIRIAGSRWRASSISVTGPCARADVLNRHASSEGEAVDGRRITGVGATTGRAGLARQPFELAWVSRGQNDLVALLG